MPSTAYPTWLYWSILPSYKVQPKEIRRFIFFQSFFAQNLIQRRVMVVLDYPKGNFGETHYNALFSLPNLAVLVNNIEQPKEIRRFIFFQSFFAQNLIQRRFMVLLPYPKGNFWGTHYYALYGNWS